ncbi:MAG: Hsp20/alpha crystallin family protein [Cytophagales bacterium]|nr:Hsp20/alpha crystallin family protein [Cytophagales bacterium]
MSLIRYNSEPKTYAPRVFSDIFDNFFNETLHRAGGKYSSFVPSVDIVENEKSYEVHAALPGLKKEDVKIELKDKQITISGERKFENENNSKNYHVVETQYGSFSRTFYLPEHVDESKISAEFKDGILNVVIPKDQKKTEKTTIQIK